VAKLIEASQDIAAAKKQNVPRAKAVLGELMTTALGYGNIHFDHSDFGSAVSSRAAGAAALLPAPPDGAWQSGCIGAYRCMPESHHRSCQCGAVYSRTESMAPGRQIDSFECSVCHTTLETWNTAWVPTYRLIAEPVRDAERSPAERPLSAERLCMTLGSPAGESGRCRLQCAGRSAPAHGRVCGDLGQGHKAAALRNVPLWGLLIWCGTPVQPLSHRNHRDRHG
jgi:hypothetical protein